MESGSKAEEDLVRFSWWQVIKAAHYFLKNRRKRFYLSILVMFGISFQFLVPPFVLGKIVDYFTSYKPGDSTLPFYLYASFMAVFLATNAMVNLAFKNYFTLASVDAAYAARVQGFEKLMNFSLFWHETDSSGAKVRKLQTGSESLSWLISFISKTLVSWFAKFVGVFGLFLFLDLSFFCFSAAFLAVFFSATWFFYRRLEIATNELNKAKELSAGRFYECTSNFLTIKSLGATDTIKSGVSDYERQVRIAEQRTVRLHFWQWRVYELVKAIGTFVFLLLVMNSVSAGALTVGFIFAYYSYYRDLTEAAGSTVSHLNELVRIKNDIARMMPIFWTTSRAMPGTHKFPPTWQKIELEDIGFAYPNQTTESQIHRLNFEILRGQKIGIAGQTGSGKSTFAKLLLGLYQPKSGKILVDDVSLNDVHEDELLKHVSVVLQESELFNLSFKENITLLKKVDPSLFDQALRIAQLTEVIEKLPNGLDTVIGEKGHKLSGGERQRVGIARAICRAAEIIILDEATSALDTKTESAIHVALEKELQDKTIIMIAHRISTLRNVDQLYVFESGSIAESGTYADLMKDESSLLFRLNSSVSSGVGPEKVKLAAVS